MRLFAASRAEPDPLSDQLKPWFAYAAAVAVGAMVLYTLAGLLNLLLGRERVVPAKLLRWDVQAGSSRSNVVISIFDSNGHLYTWKASRVAPVSQKIPVELVIDGLLWDEIVEIHQDNKVAWKRI